MDMLENPTIDTVNTVKMLTVARRVLTSRVAGVLVLGCYLLYAAGMARVAWRNPDFDWDLLGYVGSVLSIEEKNIETVHDQAYACVKEVVSSNVYDSLTNGDLYYQEYRKIMAHDAAAFSQQLPFYTIKCAYVGIVYLLHKAGMNIVKSIVLVSALAGFYICMLLVHWLNRHMRLIEASCLAFMLINSLDFMEVERMTSPDILSSAVILTALYLLVEHRRIFVGLSMLTLSIFFRTNNVLLGLLTSAYLACFATPGFQRKLGWCVFFVVGSCFSYWMINHVAGNYGWQTHFYAWFVAPEAIAKPAEQYIHLTAHNYFTVLLGKGLSLVRPSSLIGHYQFWLFAMLAISAQVYCVKVNGQVDMGSGLAAIMVVSILLTFLVYPRMETRLFLGYYGFIGTIFLVKLFESRSMNFKPV